jgi:hypothetical protein
MNGLVPVRCFEDALVTPTVHVIQNTVHLVTFLAKYQVAEAGIMV